VDYLISTFYSSSFMTTGGGGGMGIFSLILPERVHSTLPSAPPFLLYSSLHFSFSPSSLVIDRVTLNVFLYLVTGESHFIYARKISGVKSFSYSYSSGASKSVAESESSPLTPVGESFAPVEHK